MVSKGERLRVFLRRLEAAPTAGTAEEASNLLSRVLDEVEDELSDIPFDPSSPTTDGRMYAPREDSRRPVPGQPSVTRYRSVAHNTFIGQNGSIRIETIDRKVLLDKPGTDGRRTSVVDA